MLFLLSADFFQNQLFRKKNSGIASEWQTVWSQIRLDCLQRLSADDTGRYRGSYMSAHVLLTLLNKVRKIDKM